MILPDVNVLLYGFRIDSRDHAAYRTWLEALLNGPSMYGMSPQVLCSVVRIATHPRIFVRPSRLEDASAFVHALIEPDHCTVVVPGPRHWGLFHDLCRESAVSGNLVQDAWFAALAIESGAEWITTDRDYARFARLRWRSPF